MSRDNVAQEPVAWFIEGYGVTENIAFAKKYTDLKGKIAVPLYAHPANPAMTMPSKI